MKANGVSYFPHKISKDFLDLIEPRFGLKGYALTFKLLERIYLNEGYYTKFNNDIRLRFAFECGVNPALVADIVMLLINRGFFDITLYKQFNILTSEEIQLTYLDIVKKRKVVELNNEYLFKSAIETFEKRAKKSGKNAENDTLNEERKGKEIVSLKNNNKEELGDCLPLNPKILNLDNYENLTDEELKDKLGTFYDPFNYRTKDNKLQISAIKVLEAFITGLKLESPYLFGCEKLGKEDFKFKLEHFNPEGFSKIVHNFKWSNEGIREPIYWILGVLNNMTKGEVCQECGLLAQTFKTDGRNLCRECRNKYFNN